MRLTIRLPDDLLEKVALDALKKRRNSKEAVIAEILRSHYGGGEPHERLREALHWRLSTDAHRRIHALRQRAKDAWA